MKLMTGDIKICQKSLNIFGDKTSNSKDDLKNFVRISWGIPAETNNDGNDLFFHNEAR